MHVVYAPHKHAYACGLNIARFDRKLNAHIECFHIYILLTVYAQTRDQISNGHPALSLVIPLKCFTCIRDYFPQYIACGEYASKRLVRWSNNMYILSAGYKKKHEHANTSPTAHQKDSDTLMGAFTLLRAVKLSHNMHSVNTRSVPTRMGFVGFNVFVHI